MSSPTAVHLEGTHAAPAQAFEDTSYTGSAQTNVFDQHHESKHAFFRSPWHVHAVRHVELSQTAETWHEVTHGVRPSNHAERTPEAKPSQGRNPNNQPVVIVPKRGTGKRVRLRCESAWASKGCVGIRCLRE